MMRRNEVLALAFELAVKSNNLDLLRATIALGLSPRDSSFCERYTYYDLGASANWDEGWAHLETKH